jgi:hypothetical protein
MQETIQSRLESSRKELLDLGLRNPLLNYKITKGKGVHIVDEKAEFIYDILVRQQKAMTFLALKEGDSFPEGEGKYQDTKLQTDEDEQKLQSRLLNTYYFARTSIEEQGVNLLVYCPGDVALVRCRGYRDPAFRAIGTGTCKPGTFQRAGKVPPAVYRK